VKNSGYKNSSPTEVKRSFMHQNLSIFIPRRKWIKTFFKGNFLLIFLTALRTHSGSFLFAAWDNSDGVAASLCGMEIWAAAQDHSGG
jgi:hypothetical protein